MSLKENQTYNDITRMSFFSRFTSATANLTKAIYKASVQAFQEVIGTVATETVPTPVIEPDVVTDVESDEDMPIVSDGSEIVLNTENLSNEQILENLQESLNDLSFEDDQYYEIVITYESGSPNTLIVTRNNVNSLEKKISEAMDGVVATDTGSDKIVYSVVHGDPVRIEIIRKLPTKLDMNQWQLSSGGLFKYRHLIEDKEVAEILKSLEILSVDDDSRPDVCFLSAIRDHFDSSKFSSIATVVNNNILDTKALGKICNKFDFRLRRRRIMVNEEGRYVTKTDATSALIGKKGKVIDIALFDDHYFKYDELPEYCKSHWEPYVSNNLGTAKANTTHLVKYLLKNKERYLEPLTLEQCMYHDSDKGAYNEIDVASHIRPVAIPNKKEIGDTPICYFDFETATDGNHLPYHLSFGVDEKGKEFKVHRINNPNLNIEAEFLGYIAKTYGCKQKWAKKPDIIMFAHNSTYDGSFLLPYLYNIDYCEKDGRYVAITGYYRHYSNVVKILIKDSNRVIPIALGKFGKTFHLDQGKEIMYYSMYNRETLPIINKVPKSTVDHYVNQFNKNSNNEQTSLDKMYNGFIENMKRWGCINSDGTYDLLKYSATYCDIDIKVTREGMNKFRTIYQEIHPDIDPINYYSLPSIANDLLLREKCFQGTCELDGVLSAYFDGFVVGGRTMTGRNKKWIVEDCVAIDWNSLYPSAMKEFDGFLMGQPVHIMDDQKNMEFLNSVSHYFIDIKIIKITKGFDMPLLSVMNPKTGTRNWTNNVSGTVTKVDRYALEDLIEFCDLEFEILSGYYFNDGFNTTVNEYMEKLYLSRIKDRSEGNDSLAEMKKLTLNSPYGKTIQKAVVENKVIVDTNRFNPETKRYVPDRTVLDNYITKNFHKISSYRDISNIHGSSGKYIMTQAMSVTDSWNKAHQGSMILSYSKRLMNRAIVLMKNLDMPCYYQDTDSIHMRRRDYKLFLEKYEEKYGVNLSGDLQGQAKVDLDVSCTCKLCVATAMTKVKCPNGDASDCGICSQKANVGLKCLDRVIDRMIVVGKKSYFDKMSGLCPSNPEKRVFEEKSKLKGIPQDSITAYLIKHRRLDRDELLRLAVEYGYLGAEKAIFADTHTKFDSRGNRIDLTAEHLYEIMYSGDIYIRFDLGVNNKIRFEKSGAQVYSTGKPIMRRVSFLSKEAKERRVRYLNREADDLERRRSWVNGDPPVPELGSDSE